VYNPPAGAHFSKRGGGFPGAKDHVRAMDT
jgi:hypothetical protein